MYAILAHFRPLDLSTNERVDIYVSSAPGAAYGGLGGIEWEPAFADNGRPTGSIELMSIDLQPGIQIASARSVLALSQIKNLDAPRLHWVGAPVVIYRADALVWPARVEFDGYVVRPTRDLAANLMRLDMEVSADDLDTDLLTLFFSGDGAAGGDPEVHGTLRPAGFGHCLNIEPVFFDTVRNIAQIDGYGNTISIDWLGEGLSSFGDSQGDYPDYAGLAAAIDAEDIAPGQWGTCIAEGLIGLGAPPAGVITCHAHFGHGLTGDLMKHVIIEHAEIEPERVVASSFDDLDAEIDFPIHFWASQQISVQNIVEALAAACNATPLVTFQGTFAVTRPFGGDQVGVFRRDGFNEPAITDWRTSDPFDPCWQMKLRTARPIRVLTLDEVNYSDTFKIRGMFSSLVTYRDGDLVWTADGAQWLYHNEAAEAGHVPPIAPNIDGDWVDAWWERLKPPTNEQVAQGYKSALPVDPLADYHKGDLVRDQGAVWIYTSDDEWDGTYPPTLPLDENDFWSQVKDATVFTLTTNVPSFSISADVAGVPLEGQVPVGGSAKMMAGTADVTDATTWAIATSGCDATIDIDGSYEITVVRATGYVEISGTYGGSELKARVAIALTNTQQPADPGGGGGGGGGGGTGISITSFPNVNVTSFPSAPSATAVVKASATGISFSVGLNYSAPYPGAGISQVELSGKIVYRVNLSGSGWTDAGSQVAGTLADGGGKPNYEYADGRLEFDVPLTGLVTGTDYEFGILLRRSAGGRPTTPSGAVSGAPT